MMENFDMGEDQAAARRDAWRRGWASALQEHGISSVSAERSAYAFQQVYDAPMTREEHPLIRAMQRLGARGGPKH